MSYLGQSDSERQKIKWRLPTPGVEETASVRLSRVGQDERWGWGRLGGSSRLSSRLQPILISRLVSSSPTSGSVLTAQSLELLRILCLPLSLILPHSCSSGAFSRCLFLGMQTARCTHSTFYHVPHSWSLFHFPLLFPHIAQLLREVDGAPD